MNNKTLESLLFEANDQIKRLSYEEAVTKIQKSNHVIIDVREESEVAFSGLIKNAINIPRGVIEFKLKPDSPDNPIHIDSDTDILLYCAAGFRSALAAKALEDSGFQNVYNIGGYGEWVSNGGDVTKDI
ncbi:rhodanese-like domain-containing protein [Gammaproteobacteria bacterium]|nr:rhodanese-like domain-containing protein [Gammaproteobacteria bacterium]